MQHEDGDTKGGSILRERFCGPFLRERYRQIMSYSLLLLRKEVATERPTTHLGEMNERIEQALLEALSVMFWPLLAWWMGPVSRC